MLNNAHAKNAEQRWERRVMLGMLKHPGIYYVLKPPIWLKARGGKRGKGNDETLLIGGLIT